MKDWANHYQMAEALLQKAKDPNSTRPQKEDALMAAQVHATLASVRYSTSLSPRLSPKSYSK